MFQPIPCSTRAFSAMFLYVQIAPFISDTRSCNPSPDTTNNKMTTLDADTLSQIMSQALALPPDTNPYLWLSDFMATELVPNLSTRPLRIILWLAVASHAIALLCNIAVIVFRVKAGHFWVVRFTKSADGKYLTCVYAVTLLAALLICSFV